MKTIKNTLLAIGMAFFAGSCSYETIRVSDEISTRSYNFDNVTALSVATDFKAYVSFSENTERVEIRANDNLFGKIRVYQEGGRLIVRLKNNIRLKGKETLQLYITTREIRDFSASSDAVIFLDDPLVADNVSLELSSDARFEGDITTDDFELRASSDASADLFLEAGRTYMSLSSGAKIDGEVQTSEATLKLSSDSVLDMIGTMDDLDASLSSDSQLRDYGLEVEDLKISLTSDSDAYLTVARTIDVTANSDARLFYKGDADIVRQVLSSDGRVIKK
ncbi:GIN domain-containing protein [Flagellimonas flava]|uniref:Putative auto-transporter adhesin, head GIN domain n=1 Tax=Flagellimonas flava TaxID=570519 RepID=A0A1M5M2T2_9FLAO|nr:DUF2807 domain-containing protein [Allomuricauda flava]SHG71229.1 Putative auto-transporter adhesin, head GIN domain [Allomuricauda flava]